MYRDIALALRQWRTNLRFSVIVVLTLALGTGATTAIFSVVSGVALRALPFPELAFAFLISLLTGVGFGVFPVWSASRSDSRERNSSVVCASITGVSTLKPLRSGRGNSH
jgi:hypothetical protein